MNQKRLDKLEKDLRKDGLEDLVESLQITRRSVEAHWSKPRLYWFTDHSERHSGNVSDIAWKIATARELGPMKLNPLERYLLEMGCWLHDIGMQSSAVPGVKARKYPTDPVEVRNRHPELSFEAIVGGFTTGIPGNHKAVVDFLAMLAQSHGTHYYEKSVRVLRDDFPTLINRPVRGGLLAAILLMADELDLHAQRVPEDAAPQDFGAVSDAHWFKHECVDAVDVESVATRGGKVQVSIRLHTYPNASPDVVSSVRAWIEDKLVAQMAKTEREFLEGFGGHFEFDRLIDFRYRKGHVPSKRLSKEMLSVIERDNARALLINHDECYDKCLQAIEAGQSLAIIGQSPTIAEDGREDLLRLLVLDLRSQDRLLSHVARSETHGTLSPSDILHAWLTQLGALPLVPLPSHESLKTQALSETLTDFIGSATSEVILGISSIDELSAACRDWLLGSMIAPATAGQKARFVLSTSKTMAGFSSSRSGWVQVPVGATPPDAIEDYLSRFTAVAEAARLARVPMDYTQARRFAVLGGGPE